jgi:hypothetical protein
MDVVASLFGGAAWSLVVKEVPVNFFDAQCKAVEFFSHKKRCYNIHQSIEVVNPSTPTTGSMVLLFMHSRNMEFGCQRSPRKLL